MTATPGLEGTAPPGPEGIAVLSGLLLAVIVISYLIPWFMAEDEDA